ncbi:hypothetical protein V490_09030 [Pseudogymnoascus sp. VKM F-3557]|nr:hypothetical protein V490_09030 [Pseudogymnoascus sp. VKM F-3557]
MGYNAFGVFNCVVTPYQLNPTALDWGGKTAWFWVVFCVICFVYAFFRIPEPRGRTYAEMDWLFAEGISARKFASTVVPRFGDEMVGEEGASSSVESWDKKGGVVEADGMVMPRSGSLGSSNAPAVATVESVPEGGAGATPAGGEGGKKGWRFWLWGRK